MDFSVEKVMEHYNLYLNGSFIGSADDLREVDELKAEFINQINTSDSEPF